MEKDFESLESRAEAKRVGFPKEMLVKMSEWKGMGEYLMKSLRESFLEVESRERDLDSIRESVVAVAGEVDSLRDSLEKRLKILEEKEKEFYLFQEEKKKEITLKEEELGLMKEKFLEEFKSREDTFNEQLKSLHGFIERLVEAQNAVESMRVQEREKLKEVESQKQILCVARESVAKREREVDLFRGSLEKRLKVVEEREKNDFELAKKQSIDLEKREKEFHSLQENEMRKLVSKEENLSLMWEEFIQEVKFREEKFDEQEKKLHGLLERVALACNNAKEMKKMVSDRFEEVGLKEIDLNLIKDWVERKMDEADCKTLELVEQEKLIKEHEGNVVSRENELEEKERELESEEKNLEYWEKELELKEKQIDSTQDLVEQRMEELDWREKNLNSVKDFTRTCFKEHLNIKKQLYSERKLVERRAIDLEHKEEQLKYRLRDLELKERQVVDHLAELELKQKQVTDAHNTHVKIESYESADLQFVVKMDGKTLQMFLNDPEKDLESMDNEVCKVLRLSSNPAKLVLDAMEGFYPPHLRKGDMESSVRRTCILLLEQLTKLSPEVKPCVIQEAILLAKAWKSKTRITDSLEVLGFLNLLAAYNLVSCFDKDDLLAFLQSVAQHKQTPELCRLLGFAGNIAIDNEQQSCTFWSE